MEKFLGWLIENSEKPWLWVVTLLITTIFVNSGFPLLIGVGVSIYGGLTYAVGVKVTMDYFIQKMKKEKEKEKTNDTTN